MGNVFFGVSKRYIFTDGVIRGKFGRDIDGEFLIKLSRAISDGGKIGVMHGGGGEPALTADILKTGFRASDCEVLDLGDGFCALASFAAREYGLSCCVFINAEADGLSIRCYGGNGLPFPRERERGIEGKMDEKPKEVTDPKPLKTPEGAESVKYKYRVFLQNQVNGTENGKFGISGGDPVSGFLSSNAEALGVEIVTGGTGVPVFAPENGGLGVTAVTENGRTVSGWHLIALAAQAAENGKELWFPQATPEAVEKYLRRLGYTLHFYRDGNSENRENAYKTPFFWDGALTSLLVVKYITKKRQTLEEAVNNLPEFYIRDSDVEFDEEKEAAKIGELARQCGDCSRGVRLRYEKGSVSVFPKTGGGFRLIAEAVSFEAAKEICDFTERKIKG